MGAKVGKGKMAEKRGLVTGRDGKEQNVGLEQKYGAAEQEVVRKVSGQLA